MRAHETDITVEAIQLLTTPISVDFEKLVEQRFLVGQTQTASSKSTYTDDTSKERETWRRIGVKTQSSYGYDPVIIRFYEDVIAELQRELAKYRDLVRQLMEARKAETELHYVPGEPTALPEEVAQKMRRGARPGRPLIGHEI